MLNAKGHDSCDLESVEGLFAWRDKDTREIVIADDKDDMEKMAKLKWICDTEKLKSILGQAKESVSFYCGIASNTDEIFGLFDKVIVLQVANDELKRRLTHRTSNDFARTDEAQEKMLSWKDWWENELIQKGAIAVNANKSLDEVADEIIGLVCA